MQHEPRSRKLPVGLDEIPRIRPEPRMVLRHHYVPGLSGEPGKPFHLLPSDCRILAGVRVASREDDHIPPLLPHEFPERLQPLGIYIIHI